MATVPSLTHTHFKLLTGHFAPGTWNILQIIPLVSEDDGLQRRELTPTQLAPWHHPILGNCCYCDWAPGDNEVGFPHIAIASKPYMYDLPRNHLPHSHHSRIPGNMPFPLRCWRGMPPYSNSSRQKQLILPRTPHNNPPTYIILRFQITCHQHPQLECKTNRAQHHDAINKIAVA